MASDVFFDKGNGQCCRIKLGAQLLILICALAVGLRTGLSEPRLIRGCLHCQDHLGPCIFSAIVVGVRVTNWGFVELY
jgi:hypothetical protein